MKILWIEMKPPGRYCNGLPIGGWQDALENIIHVLPNIELYVAFKTTTKGATRKVVDGITYIPLYYNLTSICDKVSDKLSWKVERNIMIPLETAIIKEIEPDIVQVFGTEWPYGQVQKSVDVPVVAHMQGSIPPYSLSKYPPGYNAWDNYKILGFCLKSYFGHYMFDKKSSSRISLEIETIQAVNYYLGRTTWDKSVVALYNSNAHYFYCAEALRETFYSSKEVWKYKDKPHKIRLVTTGCTSYVKGMNILLLTAKLLCENGVDFEWVVIGDCDRKNEIEKHEKLKFSDYHVRFNGYTDSEELRKILLGSDIYVHLAYIENSPNSVCEAQIMGLPIIATYVGGVPDLIKNGEDGILIPANDPYLAAFNIMQLSKNKELQILLSRNAIRNARKRHDKNVIAHDLLAAYTDIIRLYKEGKNG